MKILVTIPAIIFFGSMIILIFKRKKNLQTGEYYIEKKDNIYYYPLGISFLLAVIIPNLENILDYVIKGMNLLNIISICILFYYWYKSKIFWSSQTKPLFLATFCLSALAWLAQFAQEKWIGKPFPYEKISGCCWGVDPKINDMYDQNQSLEFYGNTASGTVEAKEIINSNISSCLTQGTYFFDKKNKTMTLSFNYNSNCPFMARLNGVYKYKYLGYSSDDIFKGHRYAFSKGDVSFSRSIED